jgi:UDP-N-acetylglucosamine 1-carboxyvinyltransferase
LKGEVRASGNKNAALPMIAAALLTDAPVTLRNVPRISDVLTLLNLVQTLGATVAWKGENEVRIHAKSIDSCSLDPKLCRDIRASILLAGPMINRCGNLTLPPPGGDVIGRRRLDTHFHAFTALGAKVDLNGDIHMCANGLTGTDMMLDEASVTATENALMAAAMAKGTTVIHNAASEPHVQDLCRMLTRMGARVQGIGSNTLTIQGRGALKGGVFDCGPDNIEVTSFIALAAVMGDGVWIRNAGPEHLRMTEIQLGKLGIRWQVHGEDVYVPREQELRVSSDYGGQVPKIDDGIWPAYPADAMSAALVAATQSEGTVLIHQKMFESRLYFVDRLINMGARIVQCDPHRVVVVGRSQLRADVVQSPDIRAGVALVIAALCAEGVSTIGNVGQIDRGYERFEEKLRGLGARITRR